MMGYPLTVLATLICGVILVAAQTDPADEGSYDYIFESKKLPQLPRDEWSVNSRYMPYVGNGYIATVVHNDSIFINGVYNGEGGWSHRARIQNPLALRINYTVEPNAQRLHRMDVKRGVFEETLTLARAFVYHRVFAHRFYQRLYVTQVDVKARTNNPRITIQLPSLMGNDSSDFQWGEAKPDSQGYWVREGRTFSTEPGAPTRNVYMFYDKNPGSIYMGGSSQAQNLTLLMTIDHNRAAAEAEMRAALQDLQRGDYEILKSHELMWDKIWDEGGVEIEGGSVDNRKFVYGSMYNLLSSLPNPEGIEPKTPPGQFYGLSRSSLARGVNGTDYQGHVFWDQELFMLPAVLPFYPDLAKEMLKYRIYLKTPAYSRANAESRDGLRYPWESAYTGEDVTPEEICKHCKDSQIFVSAAIAYAARLYHSVTRDSTWLNSEGGYELIKDIAKYYFRRADRNITRGGYDINHVIGPDDNRLKVNNSAFTNAAASLSIHYARYAACALGRDERNEVPQEWMDVALNLNLPYMHTKRYHEEFDDYDMRPESNKTVGQADVPLMGWPLQWNMSRDCQIWRNDLEEYERRMEPDPPALTYPSFVVGYLQLEDQNKADNAFTQTFSGLVRQPFKVWTETRQESESDPHKGAVNFLPGAGGYLQSLIYGYGGVRIKPEQLEVVYPSLPPGATLLRLRKLRYLGSQITIEIDSSNIRVIGTEINNQFPLRLRQNRTLSGIIPEEEDLTQGRTITFEKNSFTIFTTIETRCRVPEDYIRTPYSYYWVNSAHAHQPTILALVGSAILLMITRLLN